MRICDCVSALEKSLESSKLGSKDHFDFCRPTGVVDRGAACYTKGTGFESRVRHGCKIVRPFIGGTGDGQSGASIIKWSLVLALVVGQGL